MRMGDRERASNELWCNYNTAHGWCAAKLWVKMRGLAAVAACGIGIICKFRPNHNKYRWRTCNFTEQRTWQTHYTLQVLHNTRYNGWRRYKQIEGRERGAFQGWRAAHIVFWLAAIGISCLCVHLQVILEQKRRLHPRARWQQQDELPGRFYPSGREWHTHTHKTHPI
jgi:hypothetical protein